MRSGEARSEGGGEERRSIGRGVVVAVFVAAVAAVAAELFVEHHGHFAFEDVVGFHAWLGFGAVVLAFAIAVGLEAVLGRGEDFYGG